MWLGGRGRSVLLGQLADQADVMVRATIAFDGVDLAARLLDKEGAGGSLVEGDVLLAVLGALGLAMRRVVVASGEAVRITPLERFAAVIVPSLEECRNLGIIHSANQVIGAGLVLKLLASFRHDGIAVLVGMIYLANLGHSIYTAPLD